MADQLFARPDAPHGVHDLLLVAAYAANDVTPVERERASALIERCPACAGLVVDLRDLHRAIAEVPARTTRPRDFRLTAADAARLRPTGLGRVTHLVHRPRLQLAQPLAAGLTMLGLAGLLVATLPTMTPAAAERSLAGGAAQATASGEAAQLTPSDAAAQNHPAPESQASADTAFQLSPSPSAQSSEAAVVITPAATSPPVTTVPDQDRSPSRAVLGIASAGALIAGLALFLATRRRRAGGTDRT